MALYLDVIIENAAKNWLCVMNPYFQKIDSQELTLSEAVRIIFLYFAKNHLSGAAAYQPLHENGSTLTKQHTLDKFSYIRELISRYV